MISTSTLSYALDEVVSSVAFETFYEEPFMLPSIYTIRTSRRRRERGSSFGGLGDYEEKTSGAAPAEDEITQQYEKDFTHVAYGKQVPIEREFYDDEEWGMIENVGVQLGFKAGETMEKAAAALFNGIAGAYLAEDSKSIAHATHTNVDGGNSQSNTGTNTLNFSGLETSRVLMRGFKNSRGDQMSVRPDMLIVPKNLEQVGWEMVRSIGKPDTANNNLNFYNGMFDLLVWDYLTDTNAWFMVASRLMKMNLIWYQRIALEIMGDGSLFTGTRKIGGYYRCSHGCKDWRWVYYNNPS